MSSTVLWTATGDVQTAEACVGEELMPDEKRGDISSVKPTGWQSVRYENVEGGSLYNRCHLTKNISCPEEKCK